MTGALARLRRDGDHVAGMLRSLIWNVAQRAERDGVRADGAILQEPSPPLRWVVHMPRSCFLVVLWVVPTLGLFADLILSYGGPNFATSGWWSIPVCRQERQNPDIRAAPRQKRRCTENGDLLRHRGQPVRAVPKSTAKISKWGTSSSSRSVDAFRTRRDGSNCVRGGTARSP